MARHLQFEQLFAPRCRSSPSAVNAPLWFHPCPDAVYGFPHARLVERVESRYQTIEIWDTPQLGALFTLDGRPMTSAGDEFIYHECMVHPAALAHPAPRAASLRCVTTNQPCTRGYSRQRDRCAINWVR